MRADVDLDQHVERRARGRRRGREFGDAAGVVGEHADRRPARQRGQPLQLAGADDLVGDQDVADARVDEDFGLGDLLAADADRVALDLRLRDLRALVRLGVRAQRQARCRAPHGPSGRGCARRRRGRRPAPACRSRQRRRRAAPEAKEAFALPVIPVRVPSNGNAAGIDAARAAAYRDRRRHRASAPAAAGAPERGKRLRSWCSTR